MQKFFLKRALSCTSLVQSSSMRADEQVACNANRAVVKTEGVSALPSAGSRGFAEKLGDLAGKAMRGTMCSIIMLCGSGALSILTVTNISACHPSAVPNGSAKLDQGGGIGGCSDLGGGIGGCTNEGGGIGG